jgi:hypothetical protein
LQWNRTVTTKHPGDLGAMRMGIQAHLHQH